jgi:predicted NUDIX family NTP pyrophosphohydrolase
MIEPGEDGRAAAAREFEEETGWSVSTSNWIPLGETRLKSRKVVLAWAVEEDFDPTDLNPGTFQMHGREYPEIDRVDWVSPDTAKLKLNPAQTVFVDRLEKHLELNGDGDGKD